MSDASVENVQEFIDRQAIHQVMMRYCHGVDRCDLDVLQGSFWEDGACDYGSGEINAMEWAVATHAGISAMVRTFHSISNSWIEVDGDSATSETYCTAYHVLRGEDGALSVGRLCCLLNGAGAVWDVDGRAPCRAPTGGPTPPPRFRLRAT